MKYRLVTWPQYRTDINDNNSIGWRSLPEVASSEYGDTCDMDGNE